MCCSLSKLKVSMKSLCPPTPTAILAKTKADIANESVQSHSLLLATLIAMSFFGGVSAHLHTPPQPICICLA